MTARTPAWHRLPLFASDRAIGAALLGPGRAGEFAAIAALLEAEGFPKMHPLWGGRYVPAVKAFFDREHGLSAPAPAATDGHERPERWNPTATSPAKQRRLA